MTGNKYKEAKRKIWGIVAGSLALAGILGDYALNRNRNLESYVGNENPAPITRTVHEEKRMLKSRDGTQIEIDEVYQNKEDYPLVLAKGLGGRAGRDILVDELAKEYDVVTFSPRNSGESTGSLTIQNNIADISAIIDDVYQKRGVKPHGVGHSTGAYCLGKLLEEEPVVDRAVLFAPLLEMGEQNPEVLNRYFMEVASEGKTGKTPDILSWLCRGRTSKLIMGEQRMRPAEIPPFLESLYNSGKIKGKFKAPTYALLANRGWLRLPVGNLDELTAEWKNAGAEVDSYPGMNHWFSGKGISGTGEVFSLLESSGIMPKIFDFLDKKE